MPGRIAFNTIPAIEAVAKAESEILILPIAKDTPLKPNAQTKMIPAIIKLRLFVKSTLFSTTFLIPIAEIIPYKTNEIPPIIAVGITLIKAANLGENESITAITAAILITLGSYTLDSAKTPVFSPYVVLAGPPNREASVVAKPSPNNVL